MGNPRLPVTYAVHADSIHVAREYDMPPETYDLSDIGEMRCTITLSFVVATAGGRLMPGAKEYMVTIDEMKEEDDVQVLRVYEEGHS